MRKWIARVRVTEVREAVVEGETKEEAMAAAALVARSAEWKSELGNLRAVDWEVEDVRPNE